MTTSRNHPRLLLLAVLACLLAPRPAAADAACDPGTRARLAFIEGRLEARRGYANVWWLGWTAVYGAGVAVEGVRAGLENERGRRADFIVGAVKAAIGTSRLLSFPPTARAGGAPLHAREAGSRAQCLERLAAAEARLRQAARESHRRWAWQPHAINVGLNMAGALVVAEGFDESRGWTSAGIGIAVGEAMILSHPWSADDDLADYEARFGDRPPRERARWRLEPWGPGVRLALAF